MDPRPSYEACLFSVCLAWQVSWCLAWHAFQCHRPCVPYVCYPSSFQTPASAPAEADEDEKKIKMKMKRKLMKNILMHCIASHGSLYRAMYSSERPARSAVQESYCSHCCCVQAYKSRFVSSNASSKGNLMVLMEIQSVPMHYQHATQSMYTCVFSKAPYTPSTALHSADDYAY